MTEDTPGETAQPSDRPVSFRTPSRRRATVELVVTNYIALGLAIVQGIVLVPLYLRFLGVELYGAWLASGSLLAYLATDFGLATVLKQKVASAYGRRDWVGLSKLISTGVPLNLTLVFVPTVLGLALAPFVPKIIDVSVDQVQELALSFALAVVGTALINLGMVASVVLQGLQRNLVRGLADDAGLVLSIVVIVVLLFSGFGLVALPAGLIARGLLILIVDAIALWFVWYRVAAENSRAVRQRVVLREAWNLLKVSSFVFASESGGKLLRRSNALVVNLILGSEATTVFSLTARPAEVVGQFPTHLSGSLVPGLSHVHGERNVSKLHSVVTQSLWAIGLVVAVACGGVLALNRSFVSLWVGPELFGGMTLTLLIALAMVADVYRHSLSQILFAMGAIQSTAMLSLAEALVRLPLMFLFTWLFGLIGLPLGALLATVVVGGWYLPRLLFRKLQLVFRQGVWLFKQPIVDLVCVAGLGWLFGHNLGAVSWLRFTLMALLFLAVAGLILFAADRRLRGIVVEHSRTLSKKFSGRIVAGGSRQGEP